MASTRRLRTFTCTGCGREVTKRCTPNANYCSLPCYRTSPRPARRTGESRSCLRCGSTFYVAANRIAKGQGVYCSHSCHNEQQGVRKTEHVCKMCGETFRWSPSRSASGAYRITYCSLPCRDADPERRAMLLEMNTQQQHGRATSAERRGYALLDELGLDYIKQPLFGGKFTPDAAIPAARLVVQFDGDYWHDRAGTSKERRIRRRVSLDRSQDRYVRASGWEVARLWASDLQDDPKACAQVITRLAGRPLPAEPSRNPLDRA